MAVFQDQYAGAYDLIYQDKNYAEEVDAVCRLLEECSSRPARRLIDIGCGTGRHAQLFAARGYDVTGVDQSTAMLERARARAAAAAAPASLQFIAGDARTLSIGRSFDAALMMFNVFGYLPTKEDLIAALGAIHRHLEPDGLFIFDFWYGPAVVADPPGSRWKSIPTEDGSILRCADSIHDPHTQRCEITIKLLRTSGSSVTADTEERHSVRYFFPLEIDLALRLTGFKLETLRCFPQTDRSPDLATWSAVAVARRI